jgi:2-dehydro-3-deoxyphosphogluconate aldolase/(4S)-4-hydroxy-2-oxoglutarate aldolase
MNSAVFDSLLAARIREAANIAVVVVDEAEKAVPLARALLEGGVTAMELTLRTPAAAEALRRIAAEVPAMLVGAGTVLVPAQVAEAAAAGASFAVAPGLNPSVLAAARDRGLSFAPGIMTPSEIEQALSLGCTLLKFFPAEAAGGMAMLKSMAEPYRHLGPSFMPLGGLRPENMAAYLKSPLVAACGGSWICTRELIAAADWESIKANAARAARIARAARAPQASP